MLVTRNIFRNLFGNKKEFEITDSELAKIKYDDVNQEYRLACHELVELHKSYDENIQCLKDGVCSIDTDLEKGEDVDLLFNKATTLKRMDKFEEKQIQDVAVITEKVLRLIKERDLAKADLVQNYLIQKPISTFIISNIHIWIKFHKFVKFTK